MRWFSKEVPVAETETQNKLADDRSRLEDAKKRAIAVAEADLVPRRQEFIDAAMSEHSADTTIYQFDCRRHGDFLTLFVTRLSGWGEPTPTKFSTSLNLLLVTEIRLLAGKPPAHEETPSWRFRYRSEDGSMWSQSPLSSPPDGVKLVAHTAIGPARSGARSKYIEPTTGDRLCVTHYGYHDTYSTGGTPIPCPAEDDRIEFRGVGSTLLVPFGVGQSVHDRIMTEMKATPTAAPLL